LYPKSFFCLLWCTFSLFPRMISVTRPPRTRRCLTPGQNNPQTNLPEKDILLPSDSAVDDWFNFVCDQRKIPKLAEESSPFGNVITQGWRASAAGICRTFVQTPARVLVVAQNRRKPHHQTWLKMTNTNQRCQWLSTPTI
jgi:hypothetical protein